MHYLVRRHLGLNPDQWDALAWWVQRCYIEGLMEEFNSTETRPSDETNGVIFSNRRGEMSRLGFTEINLS